MEQQDKVGKLHKHTGEKEFASICVMAPYVGVTTHLNVCNPVQLITLGSAPSTPDEFKQLNKFVAYLHGTADGGLKFVRWNMHTAMLVLLMYTSFASSCDLKSQLWLVVFLMDHAGNANILHYGSNRCRRVTRSIMASEIHALVLGFSFSFIVESLLEDVTGRRAPIEANVDSTTVCNVFTKDGRTTEVRQKIYIATLHDSYEKGELARLGWIPGTMNPVDALTKAQVRRTHPLLTLMDTTTINLEPVNWAVTHVKDKKAWSVKFTIRLYLRQ